MGYCSDIRYGANAFRIVWRTFLILSPDQFGTDQGVRFSKGLDTSPRASLSSV